MDGYEFFCHTVSNPLTFKDLSIGDKFILFPDDGDDNGHDNGHGGFKGACRVLNKTDDDLFEHHDRKDAKFELSADMPVVKLYGD